MFFTLGKGNAKVSWNLRGEKYELKLRKNNKR